MFAELSIADLPGLAARFNTPPARLAAASIGAGNTAGRLWIDSEGPTALPGRAASATVLWDQGNNILYLQAALDDESSLRRLLAEIGNAAVEAGLQRFGVRAMDSDTESLVPRLFATLLVGERQSMFWEWPAGRRPATTNPELAGVRWEPIDAGLLARQDIAGLDEVRQEVGWMWPSLERYERYGLGSAALLEQQLVCWCTAEYVGPGRCGIGIATEEQHRGRGLATATAAHFVQQALERDLTPCWECGADNTASARVAARLGFELLEQHTTWQGSFDK